MIEKRTIESAEYLSKQDIHEAWESDYLNPDLDAFYDAAFDRIIDRVAAPEGSSILDAGCGYCYHLLRLARAPWRITGVDFSEVALAAGRANVERAGLSDRVTLKVGSILELPFPDASFDYVLCWGVLMHIPELDTALTELSRVLKPGGKLILAENNDRSVDARFWDKAIRVTKRVLGRRLRERRNTARGIEEWTPQDSGGLMVRKASFEYLSGFLNSRGLRCVDRFAGQLTEMYTNVPTRRLKRVVYSLNRAYFDYVRAPEPALGNIMIFQKADCDRR